MRNRLWNMVCLAADYQAEGNSRPWWNFDNALEYWSGESLDKMELISHVRRCNRVWTAPSVFRWKGDVIAMAGLNDEGPIPNQHLVYLDPYMLEPIAGRHLPPPPRQSKFKGATAWRDPMITQWDDKFLLTATTGGFRWGCNPNVYGFLSDDPRGPWDDIGPLVDPALSVLFAEFERPQVHRLDDGRFALLVSCWSERQFVRHDAPPAHVLISAMQWPLFSKYLAAIQTTDYGLNIYEGWLAGWRWIDRQSFTSTCSFSKSNETMSQIVHHVESMK